MPSEPANENAPKAAGACPTCGKPSNPAFKPFCSKRCADVDLNRWLSGAYAIPVGEVENGPRAEGDDEDAP
jgi:endogenous inhibitor of DNA gyrase (YacG/DUF329 family)